VPVHLQSEKMRKQICAIFILISLISNAGLLLAVAEETMFSAETLSLDQALRIAYVENPRMIEARKEISASQGRWIQAEALPEPELSIDVGGLKKHRKIAGDEDSKEIRQGHLDAFSVKQPLDPLGTRFLRGRMAWDEVSIAKAGLDLLWGEVRAQVIELYARIQAQQKSFEIARDNLNATRQFYTSVDTRFQSGNALQSDVIRAKIEVSRAENDLLVNEKDLKVSKGEMNLALGKEIETVFTLTDPLNYESLKYQYESLIQQALKNRADLRIEKKQLSIRRKGLFSSILKGILPSMAFGVERTTVDYENDTAIILEATYPLWNPFNFGAVKEAKAEKEKQKIRLDALKRQVGLEVYKTFLEAELADRQVNLQKKALEEANELLRRITLSYETGEIPFLVFLENIKTIKETRLAYFVALKDYKGKVAELEKVIQATPIPGKEKP
jgi:cobalt-zinc-cadmium efflux system outer membrane protein